MLGSSPRLTGTGWLHSGQIGTFTSWKMRYKVDLTSSLNKRENIPSYVLLDNYAARMSYDLCYKHETDKAQSKKKHEKPSFEPDFNQRPMDIWLHYSHRSTNWAIEGWVWVSNRRINSPKDPMTCITLEGKEIWDEEQIWCGISTVMTVYQDLPNLEQDCTAQWVPSSGNSII